MANEIDISKGGVAPEVASLPPTATGGPVEDSGRGHQLEGVYNGDNNDENTNPHDPRASAPFETGQSASVTVAPLEPEDYEAMGSGADINTPIRQD